MRARLLLVQSIVAVHMVLVEVVVNQPEGRPPPSELDLEHDGVVVEGPPSRSHKDARIRMIEGYLKLLIESHERRGGLIVGVGRRSRRSGVQQPYALIATVLCAVWSTRPSVQGLERRV
jgi:hypothetical protein